MPQLEGGDIAEITRKATEVAESFSKYIDEGYDVVSLVASCSLMLKKEWPNLIPNDEKVQKLAKHTFDVSEYVVNIANKERLIGGMHPLQHPVTLHQACHAKAQNVGFKSRDMLRLIPKVQLSTVERCSGHGGSFGTKTETYPIAMAAGKPVFNRANRDFNKDKRMIFSSDCPLAAAHVHQGVREIDEGNDLPTKHPIELLASAYNIQGGQLPPSKST